MPQLEIRLATMPLMALQLLQSLRYFGNAKERKTLQTTAFSSTRSMCEAYAMFNYKGRRIKTSY